MQEGELVSELSAGEAESLLGSGEVTGGMVPKLEAVVRAVHGGVGRAHVIDGRIEHALILELFTPEGHRHDGADGRGGRRMKRQRQHVLLELVRQEPLSSQEEIRRRLATAGHRPRRPPSRATWTNWGLSGCGTAGGRIRYTQPEDAAPGPVIPLRALLREFAVSIEHSGNLVLVKTPPGAASAVARALDVEAVDGVVGTVAGDDTIMVVVREGVRGRTVAARLKKQAGLE